MEKRSELGTCDELGCKWTSPTLAISVVIGLHVHAIFTSALLSPSLPINVTFVAICWQKHCSRCTPLARS
jgi:hypothetical protein